MIFAIFVISIRLVISILFSISWSIIVSMLILFWCHCFWNQFSQVFQWPSCRNFRVSINALNLIWITNWILWNLRRLNVLSFFIIFFVNIPISVKLIVFRKSFFSNKLPWRCFQRLILHIQRLLLIFSMDNLFFFAISACSGLTLLQLFIYHVQLIIKNFTRIISFFRFFLWFLNITEL